MISYTYDEDAELDQHPMHEEVAEVTRRATQAKKAGDLETAIRLSQEALWLAEGGGISAWWQMRPHMKLAAYLMEAGRHDEAERLCMQWLSEKRPARDRAKIYDRLRMICQKQERHEEALVYDLCAMVTNFSAVRRDEGMLTVLTAEENLSKHLRPLLKRAGRPHLLPAIIAQVQRWAEEGARVEPGIVRSVLERN